MENKKQSNQSDPKEQKVDVGLAQLIAEQRFDEFNAKFKTLVHNYAAQSEELQALRAEFHKYNNIIKALEQKQ